MVTIETSRLLSFSPSQVSKIFLEKDLLNSSVAVESPTTKNIKENEITQKRPAHAKEKMKNLKRSLKVPGIQFPNVQFVKISG